MVQLSPCKGPPRMRSKLPGCTASSLRASSRPAWQWRKLYHAAKLTDSLPSFCSVQSSLTVRKFRGKERCERGHGRVWVNLWCLMSWHPKRNRSYVSSADLPMDSIRKNLAWWAVTRRTSKNHKTVKIGGWALARVWALARDNTVIKCTVWIVILFIGVEIGPAGLAMTISFSAEVET